MSHPPIKGLVRATRSAFVIKREIEYLSRGAEEALFQHAEVLSEGRERSSPSGVRCYYGSTMITVDLHALAQRWRGPLTVDLTAKLLELARSSVRVRIRAMRLACDEVARRVSDRPLGPAAVETSMRIVGNTLQMDVDVEVPVGVSSRARRAH